MSANVDLQAAMDKLVQAIEKASPIVWQAAYREVWVELAEMTAAIALLLIAAHFLNRIRLASKGEYKSDGEEVRGFCIGGMVVAFIASGVLFLWVIDYAFNPTYAAIRELKGLL